MCVTHPVLAMGVVMLSACVPGRLLNVGWRFTWWQEIGLGGTGMGCLVAWVPACGLLWDVGGGHGCVWAFDPLSAIWPDGIARWGSLFLDWVAFNCLHGGFCSAGRSTVCRIVTTPFCGRLQCGGISFLWILLGVWSVVGISYEGLLSFPKSLMPQRFFHCYE